MQFCNTFSHSVSKTCKSNSSNQKLAMMNIKKEIIVNKNIDEAWDVLGNQFGEAYQWASGLNHSHAYGDPQLPGTTCNNRSCDTTQGKIEEVIRTFDSKNYILEYEVVDGFPFFVDTGVNKWQLTETGNTTRVNIDFKLKTKGLMGSIMSPMMKIQMNKLIGFVLEDFKHYVETGRPSPRKAKEIAKNPAFAV